MVKIHYFVSMGKTGFDFENEDHYINWFHWFQQKNNLVEITLMQENDLRMLYRESIGTNSTNYKSASFIYRKTGALPKLPVYNVQVVQAETQLGITKELEDTLMQIKGSSGVYFIYDDSKTIIYIGKSVNLADRIPQSIHERREFKPRYVSFMLFEAGISHIAEPYFIMKFKPKANKDLKDVQPLNEDFINVSLKSTYESKLIPIYQKENDVIKITPKKQLESNSVQVGLNLDSNKPIRFNTSKDAVNSILFYPNKKNDAGEDMYVIRHFSGLIKTPTIIHADHEIYDFLKKLEYYYNFFIGSFEHGDGDMDWDFYELHEEKRVIIENVEVLLKKYVR